MYRRSALLVCGLCLGAAMPIAGATAAGQSISVLLEAPAPTASLAISDFDAFVGGEPVEILGVAARPESRSWETLIYFDTPLLTPEGLAYSIRRLGESAERLTALGPVTVVAADPEPRELLAASRHAHEVRESLDLFSDRTTLAGELLWRRLRYLDAVREAEVDEAVSRREMERELNLLARQRAALRSTLQGAGTGPRLLILVQDGFDLDLKRFYVGRTALLDGLETGLGEAHEKLCREIAASGWTVVALSLGDRGSEFVSPRQPLHELVQATGGRLVSERGGLGAALAELERRIEMTFRATLERDEPETLRVLYRSRPIAGPSWVARRTDPVEATAALPAAGSGSAVRLLSLGPGPHVGPTRLTAVTGDHEVDYVAFFLDGFLVDVAHRPPFQVRLDLGPEPKPHTLRAAAFSPDALELGDDTLLLNETDRPFRVEIVEVRGDPSDGEVDLRAEASTPVGRRLERVEVYWNEELRRSFAEPPLPSSFSARLETGAPRPTDHYRVVAYLDDGSSLESARLVREPEHGERLDVNLVELYAMVTDRAKAPLANLNREDFVLFHQGRSRAIEGFARAEEVPLTLGLAVDTSESMEEWQDDIREAAAVFFEAALGEHDRAFLTDFDVRARLTQGPTRRQELLVGRMGALDFGGTTALYDSILFSLTQFEGEGGRKALVVLSDGEDYESRFRPERCIREALRLGVPVYMVVLEDPADPLSAIERMVNQRLARRTGGEAYSFSSREDLTDIYAAIEADLRSQYLLTYAMPRPLTAADLGDIRVEVRDPKLQVRTILGRSVRAN